MKDDNNRIGQFGRWHVTISHVNECSQIVVFLSFTLASGLELLESLVLRIFDLSE